MTHSKSLFQRKDPEGKQSLAQWWASVVHDDRFSLVLTCARAEMMELRPEQSQIEGAELILATLLTLSDNEPEVTEFPSPGVHHHLPTKGEQPTTSE